MLGVSRHRPVSASQRLLIVIRPVRIGKLCTVEYGLWSLRNPLIYIGVLHESYGHLRYKWLKNRVGASGADGPLPFACPACRITRQVPGALSGHV